MSIDVADLKPRRRSRGGIRGRVSWQAKLDDLTRSLVRVRMLHAFNRAAARWMGDPDTANS